MTKNLNRITNTISVLTELLPLKSAAGMKSTEKNDALRASGE